MDKHILKPIAKFCVEIKMTGMDLLGYDLGNQFLTINLAFKFYPGVGHHEANFRRYRRKRLAKMRAF